jgi:hypothetical protein
MTATPCPGPCPNGIRGSGKYLCLGCWSDLPMAARRALNGRDSKAMDRLQELYRQLSAGVPLAEVQVSP